MVFFCIYSLSLIAIALIMKSYYSKNQKTLSTHNRKVGESTSTVNTSKPIEKPTVTVLTEPTVVLPKPAVKPRIKTAKPK